jgi:hypothetical protein
VSGWVVGLWLLFEGAAFGRLAVVWAHFGAQ